MASGFIVWNCTQKKFYQLCNRRTIFFCTSRFSLLGFCEAAQVSVRSLFAVRPFVRKEREIPRMVLTSATFVPQYVLSRPVIFRFPLKISKNCNLRMKETPSGTPFWTKFWTQKRVRKYLGEIE